MHPRTKAESSRIASSCCARPLCPSRYGLVIPELLRRAGCSSALPASSALLLERVNVENRPPDRAIRRSCPLSRSRNTAEQSLGRRNCLRGAAAAATTTAHLIVDNNPVVAFVVGLVRVAVGAATLVNFLVVCVSPASAPRISTGPQRRQPWNPPIGRCAPGGCVSTLECSGNPQLARLPVVSSNMLHQP